MKVVFLTSVAGNGGSAATAYHNALLLKRAGWETTLFAPGEYWASRGKTDGLAVNSSLELRRGFRPLSFFGDFMRFRSFLVSDGTDVVVVQKSPEQWLAAFVLMTIGKPITLVRLRGVVFAIKPSAFNRWLHNKMSAVICSASVIANQYLNLPGFRMEHVHTLLEGIDPNQFAPATQNQRIVARKKFQLNENALIIGTAGRPSPVKGHDVLVRAFAQAIKGSPNANIQLCIFSDESRRGPGSYNSLTDLCSELGIAEKVALRPGFIDEMRFVYHALDAYVLPSRGSEGSSRAGLEACASGLPLIASNVGVLPDLIVDGTTGKLVPPDDVNALAEELTDLFVTWPAPKKWGEAARARISFELSSADYVKKLSDILQTSVRNKGGA